MCFHTTKEDLERYAEAHPMEAAALAATSTSKLAQRILDMGSGLKYPRYFRMSRMMIQGLVVQAIRQEAIAIGARSAYADHRPHQKPFFDELTRLRVEQDFNSDKPLSDYELLSLMAHDTPAPRFTPEPAKEPALA